MKTLIKLTFIAEDIEQLLEPRLEEAKSGRQAVFFVDAAHFVLGAYLGFLWCFERLSIKSGSGRQRFNALGALNAMTHELIMVTNETYINSQSVCELLHKLAALALQGSRFCSLGMASPPVSNTP